MASENNLLLSKSHFASRPPVPADEPARLASVQSLAILDTGPDPAFDRLTKLATDMFSAPIAFVAFIDESRQWFKSKQGSELTQTSRQDAFCARTIMGEGVMVVLNAAEDERFKLNPLVCGGPEIRFYAGAPITTPDGHRVGSLCIIDTTPRRCFTKKEQGMLQILADLAVQALTSHKTSVGLALKAANDRLSLATDSGGIGIWEWDIATDRLYWDHWMYRLYGLERRGGEEPYLLWRRHLHPEDLASVERQLHDGVDGIRPYNTEFRIVWDDSSVHYIKATALVTRDEAGRPVRMVGTNSDVTARRESEAERQKTERSLRDQALIIDMADDTVCILDSKDRITYWNQGAQRLYGWNREEALGQVIHVLLKTEFPRPLADIEAELLSQGYWSGELVHTRRDSSLVTVASSWTNRYDEIAGEVSLLEINHDITASKAAERELARSRSEIERGSIRLQAVNEELEQFAYVASHDLKAPLRVIENASQWLEEDLAEHLTVETRETMKLLRDRVQRMGKLLDDLLEYARIGREPGNHRSDVIPGDVLISDVLALLPISNFTIAVSPRLSDFRLNRMPLQQVLSNLIGNAIKHHDKSEGHIEVTVDERRESYEFAVHDDGPGIPHQFHEQIFNMFQTLRPRDQVEGSGMGLALSRKTVELFGGELRVESAEGQGCTFRFTWPKDQRSGRETWSGQLHDNG